MKQEAYSNMLSGAVVRLRRLRVLYPQAIAEIDRLLSEVGEFGEVRLVVRNRRLRFIKTMVSQDALILPAQPSDAPARNTTG